MTEVTKYVCDYYGKEFEDEEECIAHEMEELRHSAIDGVSIADEDGNVLILDNKNLSHMYYASIITEEAAKVVNMMLDDAGYQTIRHDTGETIGQFYYDGVEDCWYSFTELESKYQKITNVFKCLMK